MLLYAFLFWRVYNKVFMYFRASVVQNIVQVSFQHLSHLMTKPKKWHVRQAKTQISLGIRPVWSESSLSAWRNLGPLATSMGGCPGWSESTLGAHAILFVLSWGGSFVGLCCWQLFSVDCSEHHDFILYKPEHYKINRPVHPAKTQIRLRIGPVWSVFAVHSMGSLGPNVSPYGQRPRLIWVFPGSTCHFVGFVMQRLVTPQWHIMRLCSRHSLKSCLFSMSLSHHQEVFLQPPHPFNPLV